jgi:3-deoxy-D-manno-octulosonate 8-phosphate phosphatase (KDO 8-P phosphatase)
MDREILAKASKIKMLILDVDGVLTDGSLYYGPEGEAIKPFNVRDGSAIVWFHRAGLETAVITGRKSPQVEARAKELGVGTVIQGALRKLPVFEELLKESGIPPEEIAYMGDDLHDLPVMKRAGLALAPADAVDEVKKAAHWVSSCNGGHGAVREACELILRAAGKWDEVTALYYE